MSKIALHINERAVCVYEIVFCVSISRKLLYPGFAVYADVFDFKEQDIPAIETEKMTECYQSKIAAAFSGLLIYADEHMGFAGLVNRSTWKVKGGYHDPKN